MNQRDEAINPGIVVLSSSLDFLHINKPAIQMLTQLRPSGSQAGADQHLTAPLHSFCREIIAVLQERLTSRSFEPFRQYHAIGDSDRELLVKGFGVPDKRGLPYSRIVLLLSPRETNTTPGSLSTEAWSPSPP